MYQLPLKSFDLKRFVEHFMADITDYVSDPVICKYLRIFRISDVSIKQTKMLNICTKYPTIAYQINEYINTHISKLDYLDLFSKQQLKYVTYPNTYHTRLIACAGSGKTRSIIGRIKFMVEHGLAQKETIFAITFSKHAAIDFHHKIITLFCDHTSFCKLTNFTTIDALAKSILCYVKSSKSDNVEILSIALRNYLASASKADIENIRQFKNIKHLFIDEAQDLNRVQYDIIQSLIKHFATKIHLVGDPNQNIYQFRGSSSTYLINFPSNFFELTHNYRSTQEIINFSEAIKPINTTSSVSATKRSGHDVIIISNTADYIHNIILKFIAKYAIRNDISNIAIICPTRGIGTNTNIGLSVFFNLFKKHNILFIQLYEESGINSKTPSISKGHINLITYHGTKGLEFDVVFVMDFYLNMFNNVPSQIEHKYNQYLIYVATSRAKSLMFVCTYTNIHEGYLNPWIANIIKFKPTCYLTKSALKISQPLFRDYTQSTLTNCIDDLIAKISTEKLIMIHDMIDVKELIAYRIYQKSTCDSNDMLFRFFCKELFFLQYCLNKHLPVCSFPIIEIICNSKFIVIESESELILAKSLLKNGFSWSDIDAMVLDISMPIYKLINKYFDRKIAFNNHIVCTTEFIKIIEDNIGDIRSAYKRYQNPAQYNYNYITILEDFFYLIITQYAYNNNHYHYINNHGLDKKYLLDNNVLFDNMNNYITYYYLTRNLQINVPVCYSKLMLTGQIDFIEYYPSIDCENIVVMDFDTNGSIIIANYIKLILYNFCYYQAKGVVSNLFINQFKIINLFTGLEHSVIISITPSNMFNLLIIMADVGRLTFRNMNLVYDLETNGLIRTVNATKQISTRSYTVMVKDRMYVKIIPNIIEITIKDYDTSMTLIDTLINPQELLQNHISGLTGIDDNLLQSKPKLCQVRHILCKKMARFVNYKLMAHNGNGFDNIIMKYDKLVDPLQTTFIDTFVIIPMHLPPQIKLTKRNLGAIYFLLFGINYKAHRSMADVDALIKIMRYLHIEF